jgi:hypothetical protein
MKKNRISRLSLFMIFAVLSILQFFCAGVPVFGQNQSQALRNAKAIAIRELDGFFRDDKRAAGDFTDYQKVLLDQTKEAGRQAINDAKNRDGVNKALNDAKAEVNRIKTNLEVRLDSTSEQIAALEGDINAMKMSKELAAPLIEIAAIIYIAWFIVFYVLGIMYLYKQTRITQRMIDLVGLNIKPITEGNNVIKIITSFNNFVKVNPKISKDNFVMKTLSLMCIDAKAGKRVAPALYIAQFKAMCDNFLAYIFISAHLPLIASLYFANLDIQSAVLLYAISFVLILILKAITDGRVSVFSDIFYRKWYNRLLNYDLVAIKELKPVILDSLKSDNANQLLAAVNAFAESDKSRCNMLLNNTLLATEKLDKLLNLNESTKAITWENIASSFGQNLESVSNISEALNAICDNINKTLPALTKLADKSRIDINAINKNAKLLFELRESLSGYKSSAISKELEHLEKVAATLEGTISNTFANIDSTISDSDKDLRAGYDAFFKICEQFNQTVKEHLETATTAELKVLHDIFIKELDRIAIKNANLEKAVADTSESTKTLCESVYDFTQFTLEPNFMNKISRYANFSRKLSDAQAKLLSYDKLVKLYESVNGDNSEDSQS